MNRIRRFGYMLRELIFPRRCPVCDGIIDKDGEIICDGCRDTLRIIEEPYCMKCGRKLNCDEALCGECTSNMHEFESGRCVFVYDELMKESIYRFKYAGRAEYAEYYGKMAVKLYGNYIGKIKPDALIPVPLHKSRYIKRGYNQAEEIARVIGRELGIRVFDDVLIRAENTKVQKKLGAGARQNNLKKAFKIGSNSVKLSTVILIDDIYTSGSTIDACASVLKTAGIREVYYIVLGMGING